MKANELRIGNLFRYGVHDDLRVNYISFDRRSRHLINNLIPVDEAEGIPLTEECLEKFGFVKATDDDAFGGWYAPRVDDVQYRIRYGEWYRNGLRKIGFFFYISREIEIKYVHQLQNLIFSLTGEELSIKQLA